MISQDDVLKDDFVCNFRNTKESFYLFAFESGKFIIFPIYFPTFVSYTDFDVFFINTHIKNWDKIFFMNEILIVTDKNYFSIFDM